MCDPIKASLLSSVGEYGWGGWASTFFAVDPTEQMLVLLLAPLKSALIVQVLTVQVIAIQVLSLAQLVPSDRYPIRRQLRTLVYQAIVE